MFQLADEMNNLNKHDANFSVDFIPWHQSSPNGLVYQDGFKLDTGLPPTVSQLAQSNSAAAPTSASYKALSDKVDLITQNETFLAEIAQNTFKAHKDFIGKHPTYLVFCT